MKILIAVHGFPPTHTAGAERQAERMVRWLADNGYEVEVFTIEKVDDPNFRLEQSEENGITIHRLYYSAQGNDLRHLYDNDMVGKAFRGLLAQRSFDIMHLVSGYLLGAPVLEAAKESGLRVVVSLMEFWFMCAQINLMQPSGKLCSGPESDHKCAYCMLQNKRRYKYLTKYVPSVSRNLWKIAKKTPFGQQPIDMIAQRRKRLHHALDKADLVISNSHFLIDKFAEFGFDTSRYLHIRQGLTTSFQLPPRPARTYNGIHVGYIGQMKAHKGLDLIVNAIAQLLQTGRNFSLDLWGSEDDAPKFVGELKQKSQSYPSIHWNGRYTGSQVWDVLSRLDVLVVPSRWYENSPNVILEAFKMGVPVIATSLGGMAELVDQDQNGLLFELNDLEGLKQQLKRLADEPGLLKQLQAGIPHVKTIDDEMRETAAHYHQLLADDTIHKQI